MGKTAIIEAPASDRIVTAKDNAPDPFEAHAANISDWYEEARGWLDGTPIENAKQAEAIETLLGALRDGRKAADEARVAEKRPHDEAANAVQAKWKPLLTQAETAEQACKMVLTKWRAAQRVIQEAAAEAARARAAEAAIAAAEAAREAAGNLSALEEAETLVKAAKGAHKAARQVEADKVKGLRTVWTTTMIEPVAAARWAWERHREECEAFFLELAKRDVRERSIRTISGFEIKEGTVAF